MARRSKLDDLIPKDAKAKPKARVPSYFISRPLKSAPMKPIKGAKKK